MNRTKGHFQCTLYWKIQENKDGHDLLSIKEKPNSNGYKTSQIKSKVESLMKRPENRHNQRQKRKENCHNHVD